MAVPADAENDPGSHFAHDVEPTEIEAGAPEYLPAVQSVQTVESVPAAYFPAPQVMQVEAPTSGEFGKYLPASQLKQAEAPTFEYLPAPQSAHVFHVAVVNEVNTPARTHR